MTTPQTEVNARLSAAAPALLAALEDMISQECDSHADFMEDEGEDHDASECAFCMAVLAVEQATGA